MNRENFGPGEVALYADPERHRPTGPIARRIIARLNRNRPAIRPCAYCGSTACERGI